LNRGSNPRISTKSGPHSSCGPLLIVIGTFGHDAVTR
jgi:hypothetical protein